jgi:hypothetical protein
MIPMSTSKGLSLPRISFCCSSAETLRKYGGYSDCDAADPLRVRFDGRVYCRFPQRRSSSSQMARWASPPHLPLDDVLNNEDLLIGTFLAFGLAGLASFLQGQRSQNDFVLWEKRDQNNQQGDLLIENEASNATKVDGVPLAMDPNVFDADSWKEMSRPDNYIFYQNKIKKKQDRSLSDKLSRAVEQPWVLLAMIALFLPIFSVEFFFALSRQVLCGGDPMTQTDFAQHLCSPVFKLP